MSPLSYVTGACAIASIILFGLWQYEKVKVERLSGDIAIQKESIARLEGAIEQQKETIRVHESLTTTEKEKSHELQEKLDRSSQALLAATQENMRMRIGESVKARTLPFQAGNDSRARINRILCAIADKSPDCHDTEGAAATDNPTAQRAEP